MINDNSSPDRTAPVTGRVLASEFGDLRVELDPGTGAPRRIWLAAHPDDAVDLAVTVTLVTGGGERRPRWGGGLEYPDALDVALEPAGHGPVIEQVQQDRRVFRVPAHTTQPASWSVEWVYELRATSPRLRVALDVRAGTDDAVLRNVRIDATLGLPDRPGWRLQVPGNRLRPDVPLEDVTRPVAVMTAAGGGPAGGGVGSVALIAFERPEPARTVVVWPFSTLAIGSIALRAGPAGERIEWTTDVAGRPGAGGTLRCDGPFLDILDRPYGDVLGLVPGWLADRGIRGPSDRPEWAAAMNAYEVMVGEVVFRPGHRVAPYPELGDLAADLDRIADLGYNALQLMPHQPFPGYFYQALDAPELAYGEASALTELVRASHRRGMHVLLDVILHGVMDRAHAAAWRTPRVADDGTVPIPDITVLDTLDPAEAALEALVATRGTIEHGWGDDERLPDRHPMLDSHPDWFFRDSAGAVTGRGNLGLDLSHPEVQTWMIDCLVDLVRRFDVDGFRVDAPLWNEHHNWAPRTRSNAAVSQLGGLTLVDRLRAELHEVKPDVVLFTEPSGPPWRRSMDLVYNYEEQWLVRAVMTGGSGRAQEVRNARELARWFADRNASLPTGSLTAHHLDSHDTFFYPEPGTKWRREQYGLPAAMALATVLALSGGGYMTFVGGEIGMEDRVRAIGRLRASRPELAAGMSDYGAVLVDDDDVYAVVQRGSSGTSLVLVSLADHAVDTRCRVTSVREANGHVAGSVVTDAVTTPDLLGGPSLVWRRAGGAAEARVALPRYGAGVYAIDELGMDEVQA